MIGRYASAEMSAIWSDERKFQHWRDVEVAVFEAYCDLGVFPSDLRSDLDRFPPPTVDAVRQAELTARHDVVAFLTAWSDGMPDSLSSRIHRGMTSSDVVDTALALQLREASALLQSRLQKTLSALKDHALLHLTTMRIGRTHGQHAAPDTWGHRVADFALAFNRAAQRFASASKANELAKLSGPVGTYAAIPRNVEAQAAASLGLHPVEVATQVIARDRLAVWMWELATIASICEAVALEVRLGQQSEIAELFEGTTNGQVGSSSMPRKLNPITAEKICGLARVVRSYATPVLEGVALWGQRDISHSSVERVCVPDACALTEHLVVQTGQLIDGLLVDEERMAARLQSVFPRAILSQAVVALADQGVPYLVAHSLVSSVGESDSLDGFIDALVDAAQAAQLTISTETTRGYLTPAQLDLDALKDLLEGL